MGNVRISGTLIGAYTGTVNAANVSSGQFGSGTGGGNYSFPANVGIGTTSPDSDYTLTIGNGGTNSNDQRTNLLIGQYLV